jgi:hypothetical protein
MPTTAQLKEILIVPGPGQLQDVRVEPSQPVPKVRDNELDSLPSSFDLELAERKEYEEACQCFEALRAVVKERQCGALSLGGDTLGRHWKDWKARTSRWAHKEMKTFLGILGGLKKARGELTSVYGFIKLFGVVLWTIIQTPFALFQLMIWVLLTFPVRVALPGMFILLCNERVQLLLSIFKLNPCVLCSHWVLRNLDVGTSDAPRDIQAAYEAMAPVYGLYFKMAMLEPLMNVLFLVISVIPLPESANGLISSTIIFGQLFLIALSLPRMSVMPNPDAIKRATANLCQFHVTVGESTERKRLDDVLRDFVTRERERNADENLKFSSGKFVLGQPKKAALGVNRILGGNDKELWSGMGRGLQAIRDEFMEHGTDEDRECFEYVVNGTAGSSAKTWPHAGGLVMDELRSPADEDGRAGKPLSYFVNHPSAMEAELLEEHVVCLRLYTTACYRSLNNPLRERAKAEESASAPMPPPHPFKVTIAYLADGIKRLRAVGASRDDRHARRDFWRGMRNVEVPDEFSVEGGTEYAPMSTSSDLSVALAYSNKSEKRLLFKVATHGFIDRGADLRFLSAFPNEAEFLYPPLTYLRPTGKRDTICIGQGSEKVEYTVIEVEPKL